MKHRDRLSLFERLVVAYYDLGVHPVTQSATANGPCWIWSGSRCNKGYGHIKVAGRVMRVHIAAWELVKGRKVRAGYTLDHGCRNPACWRPSHMEEVTRAVNTARGNRANPRSTEKARAVKAAKTLAAVVDLRPLVVPQLRRTPELTEMPFDHMDPPQCDGPDSYE